MQWLIFITLRFSASVRYVLKFRFGGGKVIKLRFLLRVFVALILMGCGQLAFSADYTWSATYDSFTRTGSSPSAACSASIAAYNAYYNSTNSLVSVTPVSGSDNSFTCKWADRNGYSGPSYGFLAIRSGDSCPVDTTYNSLTGSCDAPDSPQDPCADKVGQQTKWTKEYNSIGEYNSSPIREVTSQGGCGVTVSTLECGVSGDTGKFGCWGSGTYTGDSLADSDGSGVEECEGACEPKPPVTSSQTQNCTPNDNGSFTCTSTSGSTQYAPSECAMGTVNGVTGYHCVKADYVPGSATNTREDVVTTTDNGDGTTTTNTTSTTNNTHCKAGECTTTTTTTTTSTTKDAAGNTLNETKDCTGPNCDKPVDETGEGEDEEGAKFGGSGGCEDGNCAVDAFNPFGQDVIPGFGETTQNIFNGIGNSPIVQAAIGIEFPTGGSCSSYSLSLFDTTITSDHHCQAWSQFSGSLSAIFLAIWAFAAVRVFLSA